MAGEGEPWDCSHSPPRLGLMHSYHSTTPTLLHAGVFVNWYIPSLLLPSSDHLACVREPTRGRRKDKDFSRHRGGVPDQ